MLSSKVGAQAGNNKWNETNIRKGSVGEPSFKPLNSTAQRLNKLKQDDVSNVKKDGSCCNTLQQPRLLSIHQVTGQQVLEREG